MRYLLAMAFVCAVLVGVVVPVYSEEMNTPYPPPAYGPATQVERPYLKDAGPTGSEIIADLLFLRPIGFAAYLVGTGMALVATPFTLATGTTREVYGKLLNEPWNYAVNRPLGDPEAR